MTERAPPPAFYRAKAAEMARRAALSRDRTSASEFATMAELFREIADDLETFALPEQV